MPPPRSLPTVVVPGVLCSVRLYEPVLPVLWTFGAITVADTRRDSTIPGIASRPDRRDLDHRSPPPRRHPRTGQPPSGR